MDFIERFFLEICQENEGFIAKAHLLGYKHERELNSFNAWLCKELNTGGNNGIGNYIGNDGCGGLALFPKQSIESQQEVHDETVRKLVSSWNDLRLFVHGSL